MEEEDRYETFKEFMTRRDEAQERKQKCISQMDYDGAKAALQEERENSRVTRQIAGEDYHRFLASYLTDKLCNPPEE